MLNWLKWKLAGSELERLQRWETERRQHEEVFMRVLTERDMYCNWADKLADAIAHHLDVDIGEHSSANNPWAMALEAIEQVEPARN